jgi:hypothetical protein
MPRAEHGSWLVYLTWKNNVILDAQCIRRTLRGTSNNADVYLSLRCQFLHILKENAQIRHTDFPEGTWRACVRLDDQTQRTVLGGQIIPVSEGIWSGCIAACAVAALERLQGQTFCRLAPSLTGDVMFAQQTRRKQDGGGAYRDRTDDPLLAKQVLSQLS